MFGGGISVFLVTLAAISVGFGFRLKRVALLVGGLALAFSGLSPAFMRTQLFPAIVSFVFAALTIWKVASNDNWGALLAITTSALLGCAAGEGGGVMRFYAVCDLALIASLTSVRGIVFGLSWVISLVFLLYGHNLEVTKWSWSILVRWGVLLGYFLVSLGITKWYVRIFRVGLFMIFVGGANLPFLSGVGVDPTTGLVVIHVLLAYFVAVILSLGSSEG